MILFHVDSTYYDTNVLKMALEKLKSKTTKEPRQK